MPAKETFQIRKETCSLCKHLYPDILVKNVNGKKICSICLREKKIRI